MKNPPIYVTILFFFFSFIYMCTTHLILLIVLLLLLNVADWNEMQARENPVEKWIRTVKEFFLLPNIKKYLFQLPISNNLRVKLFSAQPKTRRKTLLHVPKNIYRNFVCIYTWIGDMCYSFHYCSPAYCIYNNVYIIMWVRNHKI